MLNGSLGRSQLGAIFRVISRQKGRKIATLPRTGLALDLALHLAPGELSEGLCYRYGFWSRIRMDGWVALG